MTKGGLGAPSFESYFLSAQLQWLSYWTADCHSEETRTHRGRIHTSEIIHLLLPRAKPKRTYPRQVYMAQQCMRRVHRLSPATPPYSPKLPLVGWPRGEDYFTEAQMRVWTARDITEAEALFTEGHLTPFPTTYDRE